MPGSPWPGSRRHGPEGDSRVPGPQHGWWPTARLPRATKALPMAAGLLLGSGFSLCVAGQGTVLSAVWPASALPVVHVSPVHSAPWTWRSVRAPQRIAPQASPANPAIATVSSAILPGAGQHLLGQRRRWVYLAIEAVGWAFYLDRRSAGGELRGQYRDFAWDQARTQSPPRIDGDFSYYETLSKWARSGQFDADLGTPGVQPESDPTAFNGSVWSLATQLFLPGGAGVPQSDPQFQRALEFYGDRAFGSGFLWDWTGTGSAQEDFGDLIRESDERFRQARNVVGAIIANHVVSAIDAYLSARDIPGGVRVQFVPDPGVRGTRWLASVSLALHQ